jgi:tetratricopeptide (TPR) repeat protein
MKRAGRLLSAGRVDEAQQASEKASARLDKLAGAFRNDAAYQKKLRTSGTALANLFARSGQWDKAAAEYTKTIELAPDAWEAWSGRAFVHFHRQQWNEAVSDFSKAIDLAPHVDTNWVHRGYAHMHLGQWDKAVLDFSKVVEGGPDKSGGWYLRALAYAQSNEPDKALADLRQAIATGFKDVERMKNDPKLDPLRSHEDFGKLLEELERK